MTDLLLVFDEAEPMIAAAKRLRADGLGGLDAHVPYHMPELDEILGLAEPKVRPAMLLAAIGVGAATWTLQWWTSVIWYPLNSGGRPDNSWQVFTFAVFEMGVLAAAFTGLAALFLTCGLPRLHHPFFATTRTERASDDRFYLCLPQKEGTPDRIALSRIDGLAEIIEVKV